MNTISNLLAAVANFFGWKRDSDARANSPEMRAAATGKADEATKAAATEAVAEVDLDTLRKGSS